MNRRDFLKNAAILAALAPVARFAFPPLSAAEVSDIIALNGKISRKRFRDTGITMPLLGFGTMRLPRKNGKIDTTLWQQMVDKAMAAGLNHFDTAWFYVDGKSEIALSDALKKYPRNSYTLADKLPVRSIKSAADAERIFEAQLKKCKTGYFDFYLLHALNRRHWQTVKKFDLINFVEQKQKEGKIRYIGFSFHDTPAILQEIINARKWDFVLLQINYLDWYNYKSKEQYEIATRAGIPVMVMEPLRGGALANLPPHVDKVLKAEHPNTSAASWAFRYVASLPNVLTVLSGMSQMPHLEENIRTFSPLAKLNAREERTLNTAVQVYRKAGIVPCTDCKYCMPCPAEVNIPAIFAAYNNYKSGASRKDFDADYAKIPEDSRISACVHCGACLKKCPQKIDIPGQFEKIAAELKLK